MENYKMNRLALFFIVLLVICAPVFAQGSGTITGVISYGPDKAVVHNVIVRIVELKQTVTSDDYGVFEFKNVPAGTYKIITHIEGFEDSTKTIQVAANSTTTVDFDLKLGGLNAQVTVSATGSEQSTFEALESVSIIGSTEITSRAAVGLGDVLDNEPGVSKRSAGPGPSRPVIRGFDGDRVLVSSDGVRVGSLASQSGDHSEPVDALSVERIEIVKGPATLLYGSNAIGGVVNAISGHDEGSHPGLRGYFSLIGGVNSSQAAASGGVEYGYKNWMFWGNGSGQRTSDYTAGGDFGKVQNTFTRNAAGSGGFGYFAKKAFFNATYNYYQNRYGIPLEFDEPDPEVRSLRMHRNDGKFNFGYNDPEWFVTSIKFTVDISRYQHEEIANNVVGTTFRNDVDSVRGMFEQKAVGKWSGRFGFDTYTRDFSTVGDEVLVDGPVKQREFSVFGLQEFNFDRFKLQFGGRIENNRYLPQNSSLPNRNFTGFSGAAGIRVNVWNGGAFVANYTHAFRAPALEELYNNGPHDGTLSFEIGDIDLKPETSDGVDFSLRHQSKRFRGEANFYYYKLKNFVFLAPTGMTDPESGLPIAEYLQQNSRFMGTELNLDITANKYLNVIGGLDYVNAQLSNGTPLPRIAPLRARIGLDFHYNALSIRPEFLAVSRQDKVFLNESPTAGYGVFNVTGNYVVSQKHFAHIFSVNAFNLNNKLYFNHISFIKDISPEIGRGVRFSYMVRFF